MLFKFDPELVTFQDMHLKEITTALKGSMRVSSIDGEEQAKLVRIPIPMKLARAFMKKHDVSKLFHPKLIRVMKYNGNVVSIDMVPTDEEENIRLTANNERNYLNIVEPLVMFSDWYTDGIHVYQYQQETVEQMFDSGDDLSQDGTFRQVHVECYDLTKMDREPNNCVTVDLHCVACRFTDDEGNNEYAVTPPIWRDLMNLANRRRNSEDENEQLTFDRIEESMDVNISFALAAAKSAFPIFGYEILETLKLENLMVKMNTVNLSRLSKSVKSTVSCGMTFKQSLAWSMGLVSRCQQLDHLREMRAVLKYLTTKGLFYNKLFDPSNVFVGGKTRHDVALVNAEEYMQNRI